MNQKLLATIKYLKTKKKILFLTTSNRWSGSKELPKSTQLAYLIAKHVKNVNVIEIPSLLIYNCEGNVSTKNGNTCGELNAMLNDKQKNPTGNHRCWASLNNPKDELWKVSKPLFESDCVVFFSSIRWGQTDAYYQKLIERLTWIENRHSTLKQENIVKNIEAGLIFIGHNWNGGTVLKTQMNVLSYYGFTVVKQLCWNWQYTTPDDETQNSYVNASKKFSSEFLPKKPIKK